MYLKTGKKLMLALSTAAVVVIMLSFSSCKKYDDGPMFSLKTKTARLTKGEWEVVEVANHDIVDGKMEMEFDKDGDFTTTYTYSYDGESQTTSYKGEWEWESGKESIEVRYEGGEKEEFEILRLTNDEFWFEDEDGDEYILER